MSKRKSRSNKKNSNKSSLNWQDFDSQLQGRVKVDDDTRVKWNAAAAQERTVLSLLRKKLHIDERFDLVPITPDPSLSDADLFAIGETLVEEFDASELNLEYKLDPACMLLDHADRAPGVTDKQLERWETLIRHHLPPSLRAVTHKNVCRLLQHEMPSNAQQHALASDEFQSSIEYKCFLPLMWFAERLQQLPLIEKVKEMHFATAVIYASLTHSDSFREVWRKCITIHSGLQQDIADYIFRVHMSDDKRAKH
jgi:hypothetical protein